MSDLPMRLRENVWKGRFEASFLVRYHGELATKRAGEARYRMMAGCALAIGSPYLQLLGLDAGWISSVVALVGSALAVYTLAVGQKGSSDSVIRSLQLSNLQVEWDDLWERMESGEAHVGDVRRRYKDLLRRADEITASAREEKIDLVIRKKVFDATVAYLRPTEDMEVATT